MTTEQDRSGSVMEGREEENDGTEPIRIAVFDDEDAAEAVAGCQISLVGKILTEKPIHRGSLQSALSNIWCNPKGFRVEEVAEKLFLLNLEEEKDARRILQGSPWVFRNSWLVVQPWHRLIEPADMKFTMVPVWVQLWGLPPHCRTTRIGTKIGAFLGEVLDVDLFETPDKKIVVKVLVEIDATKPLMEGINSGSRKDGLFWVDFKYERLPQFCYFCGIVGHGDQFCPKAALAETDDTIVSRNLGSSLRAVLSGRRVVLNKEHGKHRTERTEAGRVTRVVTPEVLEKFAQLSVQNEKRRLPQETVTTTEDLLPQFVLETGDGLMEKSDAETRPTQEEGRGEHEMEGLVETSHSLTNHHVGSVVTSADTQASMASGSVVIHEGPYMGDKMVCSDAQTVVEKVTKNLVTVDIPRGSVEGATVQGSGEVVSRLKMWKRQARSISSPLVAADENFSEATKRTEMDIDGEVIEEERGKRTRFDTETDEISAVLEDQHRRTQ